VATQHDFRRLALTFPEAYEDLHRKRPAFRVDRRIFGLLGLTGKSALFASLDDEVAVVKLDRGDQLNLVAGFEGALEPTETYGHHGWTYVRLRDLEEPQLAVVLRLAWAHVAPKRLVRGAFGEHPSG
jgi:hypothetical protein